MGLLRWILGLDRQLSEAMRELENNAAYREVYGDTFDPTVLDPAVREAFDRVVMRGEGDEDDIKKVSRAVTDARDKFNRHTKGPRN